MTKSKPFNEMYIVDNDCWIWLGKPNKKGYGRYRGSLAHRWAYTHLVGDIPEGYVLDHLCRMPACVNPAHLEAVSIRTNTERGTHISAPTLRGVCTNGHPFTGDNVRVRTHDPKGRRECVQCNRERSKRYRKKKKEKDCQTA